MNYTCNICNKSYKLKHNFDNHVNLCKFLSKSEKEIENEGDLRSEKIPNLFEMFQIVKHMSKKINKLEDTIKYLKSRDNKQIDVLTYLNEHRKQFPSITFHQWLENDIIMLLPNYLEKVFQDNIIIAVSKLFEDYSLTSKDIILPIYIYQKKNTQNVYIYENGKWKEIQNSILDEYSCISFRSLISKLVNEILSKFKFLYSIIGSF